MQNSVDTSGMDIGERGGIHTHTGVCMDVCVCVNIPC